MPRFPADSVPVPEGGVLRGLFGGASALALAMAGGAARADVVADTSAAHGLGTSVATAGANSTVTGGTLRGDVQYHSFSQFNVDAGNFVDVQQNPAANALVSIVRGGASQINGQVDFTRGGSTAASNVFFLNADGIVVGNTGVMNAGQLTLATPTPAELDALTGEARGTTSGAYARLVAGTSELAGSDIEIYGQINARRLTLRAGARMIVDGRILADDPSASGTITAAVNTDGIPTAGGAEVLAGGVIRLHSGTGMRVGGQVSASRGASGGLIEGQAGGDLRITAAALFETGATGAANAGATVLFTEGNAILEPGLRLDARAEAGEGGQFLLTAQGNASIAGDFDMGSDTSGSAGSVVVRAGEADTLFVIGTPTISGGEITVTGDLVTRGGDLAVVGVDSLTLGGNRISSRAVAAGGDPFADLPDRAAGNILLAAPEITASTGAVIDAAGDGADRGGMVALLAEQRIAATVWAVDLPSAEARIELTNTAIRGGAVTISARARAGEQLGGPGATEPQEQIDASASAAQNAALSGDFDEFFTQAENFVEGLLRRELLELNNLLPFRVALMEASAEIVVNGGSIQGDGNWKGAGTAPLATDTATSFAEHGLLSAAGGRFDSYGLIRDGIVTVGTDLTSGFAGATDSVVIHSHAQTDVTIKPKFTGLGVAVAITDTHSRIRMTGATVEGSGSRVRIASTAQENLDIALAPGDTRDFSASVIVSVRDLTSQTVIDGGSITSAGGAVLLQALTGKTQSLSNIANAGRDGRAAMAVTVSVGNALTELAVNAGITAGSVDLLGETLHFARSHAAEATMGVKEPETTTSADSADNDAAKESSKSFVVRIKDLLTGEDPDATPAPGAGEPDRRVGFAFALAADIALENDDTLVSLGGSYRDLTDAARPVVPFAGPGVVAADALSGHARFRFASAAEGGKPLRRDMRAAFGALGAEAQKQLDAENAGKPEAERKTKDEFIGEFGNALFLSGSVASMTGRTLAEIGPQARVTAATVELSATSAYPEADLLATIRSNFETFITKTADFNLLASAPETDNPEDRPELRDLLDIIDISSDLTTQADVSALAPAADSAPTTPGAATTPQAEDQEVAVGVNVNYFNTTHETRAAIRDGAVVLAPGTGTVTVEAETTGMFLHATNLPDKNSFDFADSVNNSVGGSINLARTARTTVAEIADGARVEAGVGGADGAAGGTITVEANMRIIQAELAYMGGSAAELAINAAIGAGLMEGTTVARIGAGASVTARGALSITATDSSVNWGSAGAVSTSENIGVGVSGTVNFVRRTLWAGIGDGPGVPVATGGAGTITAGALDISATNSALDIAMSVAGSKVGGQPAAPPAGGGGGEPAPEETRDEDDDMIIPSWMFDEDENDALSEQNKRDTGGLGGGDTSTADSEGNSQSTGWAVSGAATVNLMLGNTTTAEVSGASKVRITGPAGIAATNSGVGVTLAGAAAAGLSTDQDSNALAGSFAIHVDERRVAARIANTDLEADGAVTLSADDTANVVNVAVGGAGTSRGDLALAGSVAVAVLTGGVETAVADATVEGGAVDLSADNASLTVSIAGAVAINMDTSQGYGVGIGIGVNVVTRDALLQLSGASDIIAAGSLSMSAASKASIYGFGIAGGVGQTGIAGAVSVNVITAGARLEVTGTGARKIALDAGSLTVTATETNRIWSLGGAITGGQKSAVGGAITANVIVSDTAAELSHVEILRSAGDLGAVTLSATADSRIGTLAVAGAIAGDSTAVGVGISGNEITADASVRLTDSSVTDAASLTVTATGSRIIESLGGGVAGSGKSAGGFALTLNLLLGNDTLVVLDGTTVTTRAGGAIAATATATGRISSLAAAISVSGDTAIGGAATANVTTANTGVRARGGSLRAGGALALTASDSATIESLAGGIALSGTTGVGAAIAVNIIAHDTAVEVGGEATTQTLRAGAGGIALGAGSDATIESVAIGLAVTGDTAISGSIAVGDIGNATRVSVIDTELDAGAGAIAIAATKTSRIEILAGAAAGGGGTAVGAAISVAMIHDSVTADLVTGAAITAASLSVTATNASTIDAISAAGAVGGTSGIAGSIVYAQIGRPRDDGPSVEPLPGDEPEDPVGDGEVLGEEGRDDAIARSNTVFDRSDSLALDSDDITRARVEIADRSVTLPDLTVQATETSATRSLAGAVGGGGTAGFGAGITVNLMFGRTEAEVILPAGNRIPSGDPTVPDTVERMAAGSVTVGATQSGSVQTLAAAGAAGGTVGGAGSITVSVMNRNISSRIAGNGPDAGLASNGGSVAVRTTQSGSIQTLAGAVGIGGTAGIGGAVLVNIMADTASATVEDAGLDLRATAAAPNDLSGAGELTVATTQTIDMEAIAIAAAVGGTGAFGGSFAVSVAEGSVTATLRQADIRARTAAVTADATTSISGNAGALAGGGTAAVGLGIVTNVSRLTVRADVDGTRLRAHDAVRITADAETSLAGIAVSGAVAGTVAVTGSGLGNTAANTVEALVRNTGAETEFGGSDVVTRGSLLLAARGYNTISMLGGSDEKPSATISFSGGGVAGVGAAVTVNLTQNRVLAAVEDTSRVMGLGLTTLASPRLGTVRGVAIDASGGTDVTVVTANGAVGGVAGVAALMSFSQIDDRAEVRIGAGSIDRAGAVNDVPEDELADEIGTEVPDTNQATTIRAEIDNTVTAYALNVAVGVYAGVGAAAGTVLVTSEALVGVDVGSIGARGTVTLDAVAETALESYVAGIAGGFVGASASANVSRIASVARVDLASASIRAGNVSGGPGAHATIRSRIENEATTFVGGFAGGVVGAAGAIQVNLFESTSEIALRRGGDEDSVVDATGDVVMAATTGLETGTYAASGAGGAFGLALSANVTLAEATTAIAVDAGTQIRAGRDVRLSSTETIDLTGFAGAVGGGVVGVGASIDYARFASTTAVRMDGGIEAGQDLFATAQSSRTLGSTVAVGSVGATGLSAAITVIEAGARATGLGDDGAEAESERNDRLADVQTELGSSQTSGDEADATRKKSSTESLAGFAGGADTRDDVVAARQDIDVTEAPAQPDLVSVRFGDGAEVSVARDIALSSEALTRVVQLGGALSVAAGNGISSGIVVANVGTGAAVELGRNARLAGNRDIALSARTGGVGGLDSVDAKAATVAASAGVSAGVGVVFTRLTGGARILVDDGAYVGARDRLEATTVAMTAERADRVSAQVFNLTLGLTGGLGVVVADTRSSGQSSIVIGRGLTADAAIVGGETVTLSARDLSRVSVDGLGSTGGILAGLNGVIMTAVNASTGELRLGGGTVSGGSITLRNTSSGRAFARARGVAVGAVAIGASVARAQADMALTTDLSGLVIGDRIDVETRIDDSLGQSARAEATSTSGGILAGNGADARAYADYAITTAVGGTLVAGDLLSIVSNASSVSAEAVASGKLGGLAAIGLTIAHAGQSGGRTALVQTVVRSGLLSGDSLVINATSTPSATARSDSGSGGVVSGSGAETEVTTRTRTLTDIGTAGATQISGRLVQIGTRQTATLAGSVDTMSAAAVGVSGARATTTATSDVDTILRGTTEISAFGIEISASNSVSRPRDGYNVRSGSGGALDVSAMISRVDVFATTDVDIRSGASVAQLGDTPELAGIFRIGATSDMRLTDRLKLDSGGAIAIPIGDSKVRVQTNDARVSVGAAKILGVGRVVLYAGTDADLVSHADTKSYGAAGAASSLTEARFNALSEIALQDGALIESLGDIELKAGHFATRTQNVTLRADSRVFNKTAFPISTNPVADAIAATGSRLTIGAGAQVRSVQDVYLFAEGGRRDILGYGRGKDLYREVAAAIGSFFSNLVGGGDVSLDIETGRSIDNADNGILVNGYVRAGSRNQQVLMLNAANELDNSLDLSVPGGRSNDDAEGITWTLRTGVSVASELQDRIDLLDSYIANPALNQDAAAVAAWTAERSQLLTRLAASAGAVTDLIVVDDIRAVEGNIFMRADYVQGADSGTLDAPGDALIRIVTTSGAFLQTSRLTIPDAEGGRITLNDILVTTTTDVRNVSNLRPGSYAFTMISGATSDEPLIEVSTTVPPGVASGGTLIVAGDVANFRGTVRMISNFGDLDVRADIDARTIDLRVPNGDFILGFTPGITNVAGSPEAQYRAFFNLLQDRLRPAVRQGGTVTNARPGDSVTWPSPALPFYSTTVPTFSLAPSAGRIEAGKNVYISADILNINGLIRAGRGLYTVTIAEGIESELTTLRGSGASGRSILYDPSEPVTGETVRSPFITSDVRIYYNHATDQIEIDPMIVQGGLVEIVGNVISTGSGRIESLDGFGRITVNSEASTDIVLNRLDTGSATDPGGVGVKGVVRITDTARLLEPGTAAQRFLITEYRREGGQVEIWNNVTFEEFTERVGDVDIPRIRLTNLAGTSTAGGGRLATFDPTPNRDLVVVTAERSVQTTGYRRRELIVIGIRGSRTKETILDTLSTTELPRADLGIAPYLAPSAPGADYAYAVSGRRLSVETDTSPERKTHDSVRWYKFGSGWRHFEWTVTTTTVQLYNHRLKADYGVQIAFLGADEGGLDVTSRGNVVFGGVVSNTFGTTTATSTAGSLLTGSDSASLNTGRTVLTAGNGRIGGVEGAFRMNMTAGSSLFATARDAIEIRQLSGSMTVGGVATTGRSPADLTAVQGAVMLSADDSILMADAGALIRGSNVTLAASNGGIGTPDRAVRIDTEGGVLAARARDDIHVTETAGDLALDAVVSDLGSVTLRVPTGSILDRNDVETRDVRTEAQLVTLWTTELGLYGGGEVAREAEQLAALSDERTRAYRQYWQARTAAGGGPLTFELAPGTAEALLAGGWTEDQLDAYVAERAALYAEWNAETAFDPDFTYALSPDDVAGGLDGLAWTPDELTRSIRAGLVRETGDTRVRIEDPNISAAGDITLFARDAVGELLAPYVIPGDTDLSAADLVALSAAERDDIEIDEDADEIRIRQREDVNFAFTALDAESRALGRLRVETSSREIYLGAETPAALADVDGTGEIEIKIDGAMTDARDGSVALRGRMLVLESGNDASIGAEGAPLTIEVLAGGQVTARTGEDLFLSAPLGDMPLSSVFAAGRANLDAAGLITDVVGSDVARIVAGDITLNALGIGAADRPLGLRLTDPTVGAVRASTFGGDAFLRGYDAMPLERLRIVGGGVVTATAGLSLIGADTIVFADDATLALIAPLGIELAAASGTDVTGGTLDLSAGGTVGTAARPLETRIDTLRFAALGDLPTPLVMREATDLRIDTVIQNADPASHTDIAVAGAASIGLISSAARAAITGGTITEGRIVAARTLLSATGAIGGLSPLDITTARFAAETADGDADILLRDRAVEVERIGIGGTGALRLVLRGADMTLLAGDGIRTAGGDLTITGEAAPVPVSATLRADLASNGGDLVLDLAGALTGEGDILSGGGLLTVDVRGDAAMTGDLRSAGGALSFTAANLAMNGNMVSSGGPLALTTLGNLGLTGDLLSGGGALTVDTGGDASMTGRVDSDSGTLTLDVAGDLLRSGDTDSGGGDLALRVGGDAAVTGRIASAGGSLAADVAGTLALTGDILSGGGLFSVNVGADALLNGDLRSAGGDLAISVGGDAVQTAGRTIASGTGRLTATAGGGFTLARIESDNATAAALALSVGGTLRLAPGQAGANLLADAPGAVSTLRLGALAPRGPVGLTTRIAELDLVTETGPSHIIEETGLIIASAVARTGLLDIFTGGTTVVRNLAAETGAPIVVSALGDIRADAATLAGGDIRLFAFEGALTGETGAFFQGDAADGVTTYLLARDDLRYRETAGDLRVAFALSDLGTLEIDVPDGALTVGVLGAAGDLSLSGSGEVTLNVIGRAEVELADVLALELVRPERYGRRTAAAPGTTRLTATGPSGLLFVGLVSARDRVELLGDRIDAFAADTTPADGLRMVLAHPSAPLASRVDVFVIGEGPALFFDDPFAPVRPRLTGRELTDGVLTLERGRIGEGQVNHGGPRFEGLDVVIGGDTYFRQRDFSLFAHTEYRPLSTVDDVQVLAIPDGEIVFNLEREIAIDTEKVLVLNRRLAGVELQGGQGFFFGVGVETEIRGNTFIYGEEEGGVLDFLFDEGLDGGDPVEVDEDGTIRLPMVIAARQ